MRNVDLDLVAITANKCSVLEIIVVLHFLNCLIYGYSRKYIFANLNKEKIAFYHLLVAYVLISFNI